MKEIIILKPVFKDMIWGGNRLKTDFHYEIPSETTGECWGVSAHSNGDCIVESGSYEGKQLSWLWKNHRELFGNMEGDVFPLLIKIIDAKDDLSIQVHPDDEYAGMHEKGSLGKTECWYILDCDEDTEIVIGHNAKNKEELKKMIQEEKWDELIRVRSIKKGDFFQIMPGTVHAIKKGTLLLETQQSSDITYRLYDYGRLKDGKPRELHLTQSIDVIKCPHEDAVLERNIEKLQNGEIEQLVNCDFYTVKRLKITGENTFVQNKPFLIMSVIEGQGYIDDVKLVKGSHFIIPSGYEEFTLRGNMELIMSYV